MCDDIGRPEIEEILSSAEILARNTKSLYGTLHGLCTLVRMYFDINEKIVVENNLLRNQARWIPIEEFPILDLSDGDEVEVSYITGKYRTYDVAVYIKSDDCFVDTSWERIVLEPDYLRKIVPVEEAK